MKYIRYSDMDFSVIAQLDQISSRVWVTDYRTDNPAALSAFLLELAQQRGLDKIIFPVRPGDEGKFQGEGFYIEGTIRGYFDGTDACFLAAFPSNKRAVSHSLSKELKMLREILQRPKTPRKKVSQDFSIRHASAKDVLAMSFLFQQVFASYPTPVHEPLYLTQALEKGDIYMVAYCGDRLAGVSSAEIQRDQWRAELTNCAIDDDFRGEGLVTCLLEKIANTCLSRYINCLYSLARASSYGMNLVLHRLGYAYSGTMTNNCHIGGRFENMNIWVRPSGGQENKRGNFL
jgi:putative beta-lysine N-acetyltransferase